MFRTNPSVVYGAWPYPEYPLYYYPPPAGWVVGGTIATGLAWAHTPSAGRSGTTSIGTINIDIDRNVNIDADRNFNKWEHNFIAVASPITAPT
jgi:hypothetical protein